MPPPPARATDVVFVVSPANAASMFMPFYFLYLAGYLEEHGFSVAIVDTHSKDPGENVRTILQEIDALKPRFVGLASFVTDYDQVLSLAKDIRRRSDAKILAGNAHPSIAPEDFLFDGSPFDIVVRGEGERTLRQLLSEYREDADLERIPGIAYRKDGRVTVTPNRELMDLSECALPAYHKLDLRWYQRPTKNILRRLTTVGAVIYLGRGCPFRCTFCASDSVWQANARPRGMSPVRKRPMEAVIRELRLLQDEYGFDFFYILDDTFGIREEDIVAFCEAYRASGLRMLWGAETRVNCIRTPEIMALLKDSGCIQLDFGVETGSPELLKRIRKAATVEQTVAAFDLCRKHGIRTFANMLLNLPGETEEDLRLTHELLARIRPTFTSIGVTMPYPGTEIARGLPRPIGREDYGKFNRIFPPEEYRLSAHRRNLSRLLFSWFLRYGVVAPVEWSLFSADVRYWTQLASSRHRWRYLLFFVKDIPMNFLRYLAFFRHYLPRLLEN